MIHDCLTNQSTTRTSATFFPTRKDDESGIFQVEYAGSGTFTVSVQGRSAPGGAWYKIEEFTNASTDDHNDLSSDTTIASVIVIFPQMRVVLSAASGSPSVSAWVVE